MFLFPYQLNAHFCGMKFLRKKQFWTLVFYAWLVTIYLLTSSPGSPDSVSESILGVRIDYIKHFLAFFLIPVFYFFACGAFLEKIFRDKYYIFLLAVLFSILTEIQQYWIAGRIFNLWDMIFNMAGLLLGIPAGKFFARYLKYPA